MTRLTHSTETRAPSATRETVPDRAAVLLVLGNDALLTARPATPVQLIHAGLRAGFDAVVPGSWGDELVAAACAGHLAARGGAPAVFCACPFVAQRVLAAGPELSPWLASFVAPPAALARHLRALYPSGGVRLTYVGGCPGAFGDAYDAVIAPEEFLRLLADRGIEPATQPDAFDAVLPPDRRRFHSLPGGLPALTALRAAGAPHGIVELTGPDLPAELAQHLLSGVPALLDGAARLGCACAGASRSGTADGRASIAALEPPRAFAPVVELPAQAMDLSLPLPRASRDTTDLIAALAHERFELGTAGERMPAGIEPPMVSLARSADREIPRDVDLDPAQPPRRRSPSGGVPVVRPPAGFTPVARATDGRALPRAYVARRRSSGARPALDDVQPDVAPQDAD